MVLCREAVLRLYREIVLRLHREIVLRLHGEIVLRLYRDSAIAIVIFDNKASLNDQSFYKAKTAFSSTAFVLSVAQPHAKNSKRGKFRALSVAR